MAKISKIKGTDNVECNLKDVAAIDSITYNTMAAPVLEYTINGGSSVVIETPDTTPTSESKHLITSGAVYTILNNINSTLESVL